MDNDVSVSRTVMEGETARSTVCFVLLPTKFYKLPDSFEQKCVCTSVGLVELFVVHGNWRLRGCSASAEILVPEAHVRSFSTHLRMFD